MSEHETGPDRATKNDRLDRYDTICMDLNVAYAVVYSSAQALRAPGADATIVASALEFAAEWINVSRANLRAGFDPKEREEAAER
jgi:hypothetical protein